VNDTSQESNVDLAKRALHGVLGFAVAITLVHLGHGIGLIVALGMPPLTGFVAQSIVMELAFASLLGLGLVWAYKLPRGEWVFPVLAMVAYVVVEWVLAVDPSKIAMWLAPSVVAFVFFAIGRLIWKKSPIAVGVISATLASLLMALPIVIDGQREALEVKGEQGEAPDGAPDVLFIVMDTVRAQSTSVNGYERPTTPTLEALATEGAVFLDATAPATWSLPAHAALFTGTFPSYNNANGETRYLDGTLPTLAETLVQSGWESYAFSANPHISDSFGLTRGFQHNDKAWMAGTSGRNFSFIYRLVDAVGLGGVDDKGGAVVIGNIERWMSGREADDRPAFVFVNFLEAHFPFRQLPEAYRNAYQNADMNTLREIDQIAFGVQFGRQLTDAEMAQVHEPLIDLYDGGVQYTDFLVGEVIRIWRDSGRLDDTIVVVLADHGEVVGEHGAFGHVTPLVEEDLRVPMVYRFPARIPGGTRITEPVSTLGTFATLLDLAGLPPSPFHQVGSLTPGFAPPAPPPEPEPEPEGEPVEGDEADPAAVVEEPEPINPLAELGKPIIAERFEEEMLAARFAPGTANGTGPLVNPRGRYRTYRSGHMKLVQHTEDGSFLFDLNADPGELKDVFETDTTARARLTRELEDLRLELPLPELDAEITPPEMPEMTEAEKCALCSLGYLSGPDCEGC
jgi:arylsulfatase A-like enzyme